MLTKPIELGVAQIFGGRPPFVPIKYEVFSNGSRTKITGYTPYFYKEYMKFHTVDSKTLKTIAELENAVLPPPTIIRINRNCTFRRAE